MEEYICVVTRSERLQSKEDRDMTQASARAWAAFATAAAIILGVGLGIFFDGIVLHQILQWHYFVSNWSPAETVESMRFNTYWDGLLHSFAYVCVAGGLFLLWRASRAAGGGRGLAGGWPALF